MRTPSAIFALINARHPMTTEHEPAERVRAMMKDIADDLPRDLEARAETLAAIRGVFHEEVAATMTPVLNDALRSRTVKSLQDRKRLAAWIDHIASPLGLAVQCPRTGEPALLVAEPMDTQVRGQGRFTYWVNDRRYGIHRSSSERDLSPLSIIPAPLDFERSMHVYRTQYSPGNRRRFPDVPHGR